MTAPTASYIMERGEQLDPAMELFANLVDFLLLEANDLVLIYSDVPVRPAEIERIRTAAVGIGTALRLAVSRCTPEKQAEIAICRRKICGVLLHLTQCSLKKLAGKFFSVFAICQCWGSGSVTIFVGSDLANLKKFLKMLFNAFLVV